MEAREKEREVGTLKGKEYDTLVSRAVKNKPFEFIDILNDAAETAPPEYQPLLREAACVIANLFLTNQDWQPKPPKVSERETSMERYTTIYRYYSTQRPITPGTFPQPQGNKPISIVNYDDKTFIDVISGEAWGFIDYSKELAQKDIEDYELTPVVGFITGQFTLGEAE